MAKKADTLDTLGAEYTATLERQDEIKSRLRPLVIEAIRDGQENAVIARRTGLNRHTIRAWRMQYALDQAGA